jgi:hypothetical protein
MTKNVIRRKAFQSISITLTTILCANAPAFCAVQTEEDPDRKIEKPVVSIEAYTHTRQASADSIGFAATYAARNGDNIDQAIALCRKSLAKNNDDIDVHLSYAQLLESKFNEQGENDPNLYLDCVKEWLMVLRNEVGDEKGMTLHGVGLPFTGFLYKDDDRFVLAKAHLLSLTGIEPKGWETDTKYLQKVSKRSTVNGKLLAKKPSNDQESEQ